MRRLLLLSTFASLAFGQATNLTIGSGTTAPGVPFSVGISLSGASGATALRFTVGYPEGVIGSLAIAVSSSVTTAGKSFGCLIDSGSQVCTIGGNATAIPTGVVATLSGNLQAASFNTRVALSLSGVSASDAGGASIGVTATSGHMDIPAVGPYTTLPLEMLRSYQLGPGISLVSGMLYVNQNQGLKGDVGPAGLTGPQGPAGGSVVFVDSDPLIGSFDGVNNTFTVNATPNPATSLHIYRNGIRLKLGFDYSFSGTTVTFLPGATPQGTDTVLVDYRK